MDQKVVEMDNDGMQDPPSDLFEVRLTRSNLASMHMTETPNT